MLALQTNLQGIRSLSFKLIGDNGPLRNPFPEDSEEARQWNLGVKDFWLRLECQR